MKKEQSLRATTFAIVRLEERWLYGKQLPLKNQENDSSSKKYFVFWGHQ